MRRISVHLLLAFSVLIALTPNDDARAAELKLLVTNGTRSIVDELGPQFERTTGHKLLIKYEGSPFLQKAIESGESFDVALLTVSSMDTIAKVGKIDAATRTNVARSGIGIAMRTGGQKPDISTTEAFKRAMLGAKSIAYVTVGASGRHFIAVCERLGIAEEVKAKGKTRPSGNVAELVAKGEAELAIQQISELLSVAGTELVGPLPPELQLMTTFTAAVGAQSTAPDAAKAFMKFIGTPEALAVIKAKGMEPG
jgi:molybdate transport system substrate-binding protein